MCIWIPVTQIINGTLSGANGINIYNVTKTDAGIIEEHVEKLNFYGKAWLEGNDLSKLDILPSNIMSFEPIYDINLYSEKEGVNSSDELYETI